MYSKKYKESFVDTPCADYSNCVSCANKADCTWCSSSKKCLTKAEIKDTDLLCNPINLVHTAPMCQKDDSIDPIEPAVSNDDVESNPLYHDQIEDKTAPPMVYLAKDMIYSPETVMAHAEHVLNELQLSKQNI